MVKYGIDGLFLTKRMMGMVRFSWEIINELDKIAPQGMFTLITPDLGQSLPILKNIEIVCYGKGNPVIWKQFLLPHYLKKKHLCYLGLFNTFPFLSPGVVCLHDIIPKVAPECFQSLRGKLGRSLRCLQYSLISRCSPIILTISDYSKEEIEKYYPKAKGRVFNIGGSGWQHMNDIYSDDNIFNIYPQLKNAPYFFALGSVTKTKNLIWIVKTAKCNPDILFAIAGKARSSAYREYSEDVEQAGNILHLGYVTDGQAKALMQNCKAFLFPSLYEGFGLPPLEALSVGAKAIVSNASCLPEIYGDSVYYIDPYRYNTDLSVLLEKQVSSPQLVLNKYSWTRSAEKLLELLSKDF